MNRTYEEFLLAAPVHELRDWKGTQCGLYEIGNEGNGVLTFLNGTVNKPFTLWSADGFGLREFNALSLGPCETYLGRLTVLKCNLN